MTTIDDRAYRIESLVQLLQRQNNGDDLAEIDADLRNLIETVGLRQSEDGGTAAGTLTLVIQAKADAKGIAIAVGSTVKLPPRPMLTERYFATEDHRLTTLDPTRGPILRGLEDQSLGRRPRGAQ